MSASRSGTSRSRPIRSDASTQIAALRRALHSAGNAETAAFLQKFFQTQRGGYGEGDRFIGVRVPAVRRVAKQFRDLPRGQVRGLLRSKIHEERLTALMILVEQFSRGTRGERERIFRMYTDHLKHVNNWDLVDASAPQIVGKHLRENGGIELLETLAGSTNVWERRVAVVATHDFIRVGEFRPTFRVAEMLLDDPHDLIHKAAGWMLREVGKRDGAAAREFLRRHVSWMPRTMLRYAIERFPERERQSYLKGRVM